MPPARTPLFSAYHGRRPRRGFRWRPLAWLAVGLLPGVVLAAGPNGGGAPAARQEAPAGATDGGTGPSVDGGGAAAIERAPATAGEDDGAAQRADAGVSNGSVDCGPAEALRPTLDAGPQTCEADLGSDRLVIPDVGRAAACVLDGGGPGRATDGAAAGASLGPVRTATLRGSDAGVVAQADVVVDAGVVADADVDGDAGPDAAPAPGVPPLTPSPEPTFGAPAAPKGPLGANVAVVATEGQLLALDERGALQRRLSKDHAVWCAVDARAGVLWYVGGTPARGGGATDLALKGVDLRAAGPPRAVVGPLPGVPAAVGLRYADGALLSDSEPHEFQLGLLVELGPKQRVGAWVGCDGDAAWFCYSDPDSESPELLPPLQARRTALDALVLRDAGWLRELSRRGGTRPLHAPAPERATPPRVAEVAPERCQAEPADCGAATWLGTSALQRVVVGNDRADYYHEQIQVFDPNTRTFFRAADPSERHAAPLAADEPEGDLLLAPSAGAYTLDGRVVHMEQGLVFDQGRLSCGWAGGGWRYRGSS